MRPQTQIVFEDGKGDCLRACVASILDRDLLSVPNFCDDLEREPGPRLKEWLAEQGYSLLSMQWVGGENLAGVYFWTGPEYVILAGPSPRCDADGSPRRHAVVGRLCSTGAYGVEVAHDPHPSRAGLAGPPDGLTVIWQGPAAMVIRTATSDQPHKEQ